MTECSVERISVGGAQTEVPTGSELSSFTTLRVGGPADKVVVATTEAELIEVVSQCDDSGVPVLVLGGGSNLLIADEGFRGTAVVVGLKGISADVSNCGGAAVRVAAGENWDDFVALCVEREWSGAEALSGIPGSVGATPIQNVGAYGAEVAQYVTFVRTWDRQDQTQRTFPLAECGFGYRTSRFKAEQGRYLVLEVGFQFPLGSLSAQIRYAELAGRLGVQVGQRAPAQEVRETVLALRSGKGMVLDAADHDTWSAGSFFTNPILSPEQSSALPTQAPRFPTADGRVKTSAAWLIQHAGMAKGFGNDRASLSTKHVLALTNRGSAGASDLVDLARQVRFRVQQEFGVLLVPEVNLIGVHLDEG